MTKKLKTQIAPITCNYYLVTEQLVALLDQPTLIRTTIGTKQ